MIDEFDSENPVDKRIQEYETIISQLKKNQPGMEVKLCNDTSIHLEEVGFSKLDVYLKIRGSFLYSLSVPIVLKMESL